MRDILKFHGHTFTEDMVFGLGSGIDFMYIVSQAFEPPVYIGGRAPELEFNLCRRIGVGIELVTGLDPEAGWLAVKDLMDAGTPVMVHADVYYLDYLRAKRHFSAHRIVLVGYDDESGVAFVADNDRDEIQECSLESLRQARSSTALPRPADNAFYTFEVPASLTPVALAVPPAVAEAVRHEIGLEASEASFELDGFKVGLGMTGLEAFSAEMPAWPDMMSDEALTLLCKNIYVSAEKGGTGYGGNFRRMYGRFLAESSAIEGLGALGPLADEFVAIGDVWTRLSLTFKELSGEARRAVEEAQPVAAEITRREKDAFNTLSSANERLLRS